MHTEVENLTNEQIAYRNLLVKQIQENNDAYRAGTPIISDAQYDQLVNDLKDIDPQNDWFQTVEPGFVSAGRKRKLPIPMKSLNKIHCIAEFNAWVRSCKLSPEDALCCMPKLDGGSWLRNELTDEVYSRGGKDNEGQDCSAHYAKVPCRSNTTFEYTFGEYIISKDNWRKHFQGRLSAKTGLPYKSARNTVCGLINADEASPLLQYVDYYRYGFSGAQDIPETIDDRSFSAVFDYMCIKYNQTPLYATCKVKDISEVMLQQMYNMWSSTYNIDGVVVYVDKLAKWDELGRVSNGNPAYAIAYKGNFEEKALTPVKDVIVNVSKNGYLRPIVQIQPVDLAGATIDFVTGNNAKFLKELHIAPGVTVEIKRSGEVIPKILTCTRNDGDVASENQMWKRLSICPSCGKPTVWNESGTDLMCTNPDCEGILLAKTLHFFLTMGCEGVGPEMLTKLFDLAPDKHKAIHYILNMTGKDYYCIDGFGPSYAALMLTIAERIKQPQLCTLLMHASDCFEGIGQKKAEGLLAELLPMTPTEMIEYEIIPEYGEDSPKTWISFCQGLPNFFQFLNDSGLKVSTAVPKYQINKSSKCAGIKVCFSGIRISALESDILAAGGSLASGVSKNTTHLIVADVNSHSSKSEKARTLGLPILTAKEFREMFDI